MYSYGGLCIALEKHVCVGRAMYVCVGLCIVVDRYVEL